MILATAPDSKAISALVDGLGPDGKLVIVGAGRNRSPSLRCNSSLPAERFGDGPQARAKDSEDTLQFSSLTGVRPMIERYPLEKVAEAYDQMISGRARFRVVLTMGK